MGVIGQGTLTSQGSVYTVCMTDSTIAQASQPKPITQIATRLGIPLERLYPYGTTIAKVEGPPPAERGRLILVTAITPTPAGEGKTTISIGLTQALGRLGKRVAVALREPSLGPVFGIKGGATGGGYAQVVPMEEINLHFTGDFHAVTAANNLLCAVVDNHLQQGNALGLDPRRIEVRRVLDSSDRALRSVVLGLGGPAHGVPRESAFDITAASEVMAIMALARDIEDLKVRLGAMRVGTTYDKKVIYARDLKVPGAMAALLAHALKPNLVQTIEGQAAFVHMGPFANIAHGANSVLATRMALGYADYVVTEAGFGSDLGAEKFFNVVARQAEFAPEAVVLVATVRALRYHGGAEDYQQADPGAVERGLDNLAKHVENITLHGFNPVIALNRFADDTDAELQRLADFAASQGLRFALADCYAKGGEGGLELAHAVLAALDDPHGLTPLYEPTLPLKEKIARIATRLYGAAGVAYTQVGERALKQAGKHAATLPVIMAKTPLSLSDDPKRRNRPQGFAVTVTDVKVRSGAGFVVVYLGDIMTMPGLPQVPAAEAIDLDAEGKIHGLF